MAFLQHILASAFDPPVSHFFDPMPAGHFVQARSGESLSSRQIANPSSHISSRWWNDSERKYEIVRSGYKPHPQHTSRWQRSWRKSDRNTVTSEEDEHQVRIAARYLAFPLKIGESLRASWMRSAYKMDSQSSLRWSTLSNRRTNCR